MQIKHGSFSSNQALAGTGGIGGTGGTGSPAGASGPAGADGQGIGGGIYIAGGTVKISKKTRLFDNFASTSDDDVFGVFTT
jgi:hypothetical protein